MIKTITVAICDICGATEQALLNSDPNIQNKYKLPNDWVYGRTEEVHICPMCKRKLEMKPRAKRTKQNDS